MRNLFAVFFSVFCVLQYSTVAVAAKAARQAVDGGTKVASAGTNSLVDSDCTDSYFGCMDAFCMLDNVSGGRCVCSNKHADLSEKFNELLSKEERASMISQYGSDFVKTEKISDDINQIVSDAKTKPVKQKTLSRADWDNMFAVQDDEEDEDDFVDETDVSGKRGDELYAVSDAMCIEQIPDKCKSNVDMLKMLYAQKIKSDCVAFENSIKKNTVSVNEKLADAEKTVRNAALNELQNANKYNLGQCEKEFKQCMQTTAECGNDFVGCVALSANENVKNNASKVAIEGDFVSVEISAPTMDNLIAKRVLCDSVLENCVNVRDNVWDTFLKDIALTLQSAELAAEDNLRNECIPTISDCFARACREHMDVNDPDGSYDMCLARPENYKSFCKVELEPCLAATGGSYEKPAESRLWNGVLSQLASMRANACNKEFKECIQSEDRCGEDYSQCIGLDSEIIANMCPDEKLTACYYEYENNKETVRETLARVAEGVMIGVQSELANACQKAVSEAMMKVCGDTESCNEFIVGDGVGGRSLGLKFCENENKCVEDISSLTDVELGKTVRNADLSKTKNERNIYGATVFGRILWDQITPLDDYSGIISGDDYMNKIKGVFDPDPKYEDKIKTEIGALSNAIKNTIATLESDANVQFCMTGRVVAGLVKKDGFEQFIGKENNPVYPNITQEVRSVIINGALLKAQQNYNAQYDKIMKQAVDDTARLEARYAQIEDSNAHLDEQDVARQKCITLGEWGAISNKSGGAGAKKEIVRDNGNDGNLVGYSSESTYILKRQVTTSFNMDNMICTKCTRTQECENKKKNYCKKWGDEQETCEDIQY